MKRLAPLAAVVLAGCSLDLGVPSDVAVTCTSNAECPSGTICDTNQNKCVASATPSLFVGVPNNLTTRYTREVPFTVSVLSANAGNQFDVAIDFRLADGDPNTWLPMTLGQSSASTTGITGSPSGTTYDFVWDALADATYANGLTLARVDLDGNGEVANPIVRTAKVIIRATAKNDSGSVVSIPTESAPFSIGNDPPTATIIDAVGESGVINVIVGLEDASADVCGFELEFRGPDGVWRAAALTYGNVAALGCLSNKPLSASVGWDSRAPYFDPSAQPVTTPQGIGNATVPNAAQSARILLRARAYDNAEASGTESHWGLWSPPRELLRIVNQSSPVIVNTTALRASVIGGTGAVHIRYTLIDAESDNIDVSMQFSNDAGAHWNNVQEYPFALSEGLKQLPSAPLNPDGTGGVEHLFTWDASAIAGAPIESTTLRIVANDGSSAPSTATVGLATPAGPGAVAPHNAIVHPLFSRNLFNSNGTTQTCCVQDAAFADFDNDGKVDMAFAKDGSDAITIVRNTGTTTPWAESYLAGAMDRLVAGDFTHSGNQSLLGITQAGAVTMWHGNGNATFTSDSTFSIGFPVAAAASADFDNDGYADLAVIINQSSQYVLAVYMNTRTTNAHFSVTPSYTLTASSYSSLAVGDLDGDGVSDIAYLAPNDGRVLLSNLNGTFTQAATFTEVLGFDDATLAIADFDGDGRNDIVHAYVNALTYYTVTGPPGGLTLSSSSFDVLSSETQFVDVADVNGDGRADVVASDGFTSAVTIALSQVDPLSGTLLSPAIGSSGLTASRAWTRDLDNDGTAELVSTFTNGPATFTVLVTDSAATVGGQMFRPAAPVQTNGVPVLANFDADDIPDIFYCGQQQLLQRGLGFAGVGGGTFGVIEQSGESPFFGVADAKSADVNGDGALDVVCLGTDGSNNAVLGWSLSRTVAGLPDARFASGQVLPVGQSSGRGIGSLVVADLDLDGYPDAVYVYSTDNGTTNYLGVAFNRAGAGFTAQDASYLIPSFDQRLSVGYVGNDGLPDVIALLSDASKVRVYANVTSPVNRSNPFTPVDVTLAGSAGTTELVDINWDGVGDLVQTYGTFTGMALGIAGGGFQIESNYFVNGSFQTLRVFDASLDGINDFVVLGTSSGTSSEVAPALTINGVPTGAYNNTAASYAGTAGDPTWVRDMNCDAVTDYVAGGTAAGMQVMLRERNFYTPSLALDVLPYTSKHTALLTGVGLSGQTQVHAWHIATGAPCSPNERWEDALREARAKSGASPRFKPLAAARWLGETTRYVKTRINGVMRWQRQSRFPQALNVDVPRALVATIPVLVGRRATIDTNKVRVYVQRDALLTAADVATDALHSDPAAATLLPTVLMSNGITDVVKRRYIWEQIPVDADANLSTGTGKRYIYDATSGHIDILTDEGGLYVAVQEL